MTVIRTCNWTFAPNNRRAFVRHILACQDAVRRCGGEPIGNYVTCDHRDTGAISVIAFPDHQTCRAFDRRMASDHEGFQLLADAAKRRLVIGRRRVLWVPMEPMGD